MSSSNRRERELAKAKRERQLATAKARSENQKKSFSLVAVAAVAATVILGYLLLKPPADETATPSTSPSPSTSASPTGTLNCETAPTGNSSPQQWTAAPAANINSGTATWKLTTNCGDIEIELLPSAAPQTVSTFAFLTENNYFDNTPCHRLTTAGLYVLQCGDPTGTGTGGPGFSYTDENLPTDVAGVNYPTGTVAMANSGPNTNGSQFFIVYGDTTLNPAYTIFGKVTKGLELVQAIAAEGDTTGAGDGAPRQAIGILDASVVKG